MSVTLVDGWEWLVDGRRRLRHARAWMLAVFLLVGAVPVKAQVATDLNEGLQVTKSATTGVFTLSWWGKAGRTYFIQQSFDLVTWQYVPVVLSGSAAVTGMNFSCAETRQFWKLRYTDDSTYGLSAEDADFDYDGLSNQAELSLGLDPLNVDTDGDELNDGWEVANNLDAKRAEGLNGAQGDPDSDGLVNLDEWYHGTDPHDADSDNDTLSDFSEVYVYFTYPNLADSDGDGLSDAAEVLIYFTAPLNGDTDGDSLSDEAEVNTHHTNPLSKDTDGDGLDDHVEINTHQTNPNAADSDNDGITDKSEIKQGTNANSASSRPAFESIEVVGDGTVGVRKTKQLTITLPQGERSYMVVIAAMSDEYPKYTGDQSEFDDVVDWKITPAGGTVIQGSKHVNDLHGEWQQSVADGTTYLGLSPVAIVKIGTIQGKASGTTSVEIELGAKNVSDALLPSTLAAALLPIEVKVTDFATKSDTVPYVATTNATPPKNSELCLKADKTNEKAKVEIELPSITDATVLSKMKWKVVKKPADSMVSESVFGGATPPSAELSLGSGSSVEDEILFEVQVGADGSSFTPAAKMNVRVVRDRLNWWFEPFSSNFGWRTAKPEPRADTGDYPAHKANAYKRESLQSVYEFFKSSTAIGPSTPKANWAKSSITCFGQFHDALKTANGNNPLVDLTSLARINMTAVTELPSFDLKYGALRSALGKQTTYPSDANPTLRATQFPERVQFATAAAAAVGDANLTRARLMSLWTREGSMDVSSQHTRTGYNPWPLGFGAAVTAAPASEADAKAIFIYDVAYICLGSDFLLKHSGGADNEPDLRDYPAALAHFKSTADATGGAGIGDRIVSNLTVAGSVGSYTVSANGAFYEDMLTLAGKHFVSVWQAEGPDATYMAYNMGVAKFNQMKATLGGGSYPERGRLGLMDWAIHYEIRSGEWDQPRDFAQKFHAYRMAFEAKYP